MDGEVVAAAVLNGGGEGADVCVSVGEEGRLHIIHLSGVSPLVHSLRISCHERPKAPATVTNGKPATGGGKPGAPASSGVGTTWDPETNNAVTAVLRRHFSRKRVIGVEGDGRSVCAVFGREWTLLTLEKALAVVISREVAEKSARSLYG
ncbi:hypothetical protein M427DRAFT_64142 [Gonapodya prolifera JEL478]|uniref:Uncharacterized protein n=1 Tax=Gonapodya prolifera (strain JEL478) TaxID=1344416 RepID=A0A138ZYP7_GONPJ|nr:hypothetical protein M427DRAFT_64142 [Gonapodya prolifera JEL478]|eukprot:KXS09395.1 hypothetical protein M427DRAFT_64142 [Gonapodya prolifera JEL478]